MVIFLASGESIEGPCANRLKVVKSVRNRSGGDFIGLKIVDYYYSHVLALTYPLGGVHVFKSTVILARQKAGGIPNNLVTIKRKINTSNTESTLKETSSVKGTLGFDYTLGSQRDADFHFNAATGRINFPVVLENGQVTTRKISYTFNGRFFERKNN
jgi:hypothetical protein